jgi:glycerophosphoryl diester phosphodiesterase
MMVSSVCPISRLSSRLYQKARRAGRGRGRTRANTGRYGAAKTAPIIEAHRGDSAQAPENTLAAFRRALVLGVAWIELDIHLTAMLAAG